MYPYFSLARAWIYTIDVDTFVMEYSSVQVETDDTVLLFFFFFGDKMVCNALQD